MQTDAFLIKQSRILVSLGPLRLINGTTQLGRNGGCWCEQREVDLLQAPVSEVVIKFLSQLYTEGKSYITVNTYRSALSSTLYPVNNDAVGSHPLVARLLKKLPPQKSTSTLFVSLGSC